MGRNLYLECVHHADQISDPVKRWLAASRAVGADRYAETIGRLRAAVDDILTVFDTVDVILTPSAIGEAPRGLSSTGDPLFCTPWTAVGAPTLNVPGAFGVTGLPLGIQLIAAPGRDADLIRWACHLQHAMAVG